MPTNRERKGSKSPPVAKAPTGTALLLLAANPCRISALLVNNGSVTVYLGKDNTVTSSNGQPLLAQASLTDLTSSDAWWGIAASSTGDIRVTEVS